MSTKSQSVSIKVRFYLHNSSEIINTMVEAYGKIFGECKSVYDGKKSMYTKDILPMIGRDRTEVEVTMPGDSQLDRKFKVGIKFVATVC